MLNADRPGNVMSMASTVPVVTFTVSVPEKGQVALFAQEPKLPPDVFSALPDTSNTLIVSAFANRAGNNASATRHGNKLKDQRNEFCIVSSKRFR